MSIFLDGWHWLFEAVSDLLLGALIYWPARRLWRRWHEEHDQDAH